MAIVTDRDYRTQLFILCCGLTVIALYVAVSSSKTIPGFAALYSDYGASLPELTQFMLRFHYFGVIPPAIALLGCLYVGLKWRSMPTASKGIFLFAILAFLFSMAWRELLVYAVWQPVLHMGATVGQ